ncbi:class I SAM-dependent methyltransferase [Rugosimonospora africana]|uniref:Methyltransferase domain-containing protein n=1 Tax=Rugosimonospora africana TaxID=556532 RepID=A0A8J3R1K4_9ACTN|nr:class I SAM-dependent methyltransferase [Rugosimonospora africana]GIH20114.1 hypothetical protein Raf01_82860 [Rugosimonospora africana]
MTPDGPDTAAEVRDTGVEARDTAAEVRSNRVAWEAASQKHVREYADHLRQARDGSSLFPRERELLEPLLRSRPEVVHLQSGHGLDDVALAMAGAASVVSVDFSEVAATAAQRRADELGVACRYLIAQLPGAPLRDGCADLVYTGKGALIWMPGPATWRACSGRRATCSCTKRIRRYRCGRGTRTNPGSVPTAATSGAATSTTPSRPAVRWSSRRRSGRS